MTTNARRVGADAGQAARAWQDSMDAMMGGYLSGWRQWADLFAGGGVTRGFDGDAMGDVLGRIAESTSEVTAAQMAVAAAWLRHLSVGSRLGHL